MLCIDLFIGEDGHRESTHFAAAFSASVGSRLDGGGLLLELLRLDLLQVMIHLVRPRVDILHLAYARGTNPTHHIHRNSREKRPLISIAFPVTRSPTHLGLLLLDLLLEGLLLVLLL